MTDITLDIGSGGVEKVTQTPRANSMEFSLDTRAISSSLSIKRLAHGDLQKYRVVKHVNPNRAGYPDVNSPGDAELVLGLTIENTASGGETVIRLVGEVEDPSWNWIPGPVYCGVNGTLVQVPPSGLWQRQIGSALSPTRLLVELRPVGATARTLLSGFGDPSDELGSEGDFYMDISGGRLYGPKEVTAWADTFLDLTGPRGPVGNVGPSGPPAPLRMNIFAGDRPGPGEYLFRYIVQDGMYADITKCRASAEDAGLDTSVFEILRNGAVMGTVTFPAGSTLGSVEFTSTVLQIDDVLALRAPLDTDDSLAQISFAISWILAE